LPCSRKEGGTSVAFEAVVFYSNWYHVVIVLLCATFRGFSSLCTFKALVLCWAIFRSQKKGAE
jgi:tetrahydromethanopterin S-methyltransferase subunit E